MTTRVQRVSSLSSSLSSSFDRSISFLSIASTFSTVRLILHSKDKRANAGPNDKSIATNLATRLVSPKMLRYEDTARDRHG